MALKCYAKREYIYANSLCSCITFPTNLTCFPVSVAENLARSMTLASFYFTLGMMCLGRCVQHPHVAKNI